jgi:N-acyl-L-homoserine lactone synthetase
MAYSFPPGFTMFSAGGMAQLGEWSRFNNQGQEFPRAAQLGEWSRFNNQGQEFPRGDSFSSSCTMISAEGMIQLGEWSKIKNQWTIVLLCLRRIVQIAHG